MMIDLCVKKFAKMMQIKLNKNKFKKCSVMNSDNKGRKWDQCPMGWLLFRLRQEIMELEEAYMKLELLEITYEEIESDTELEDMKEKTAEEAVDVGNFAMMIFDNLSNKKFRHDRI